MAEGYAAKTVERSQVDRLAASWSAYSAPR
jgi:hypothetical protein